jgi:hypothetical protein
MKKLLIIGAVLVALMLVNEDAFARSRFHGHGHSHFSFGLFVAPPVFVAPPPVYYRSYYPPYDYGYYPRSSRVWIPGYWGWRRGPYGGWERAWIPGYWNWR